MRSTIIISVMGLVVFFACNERFSSYYPKYEDAVKQGAVQRGWIPKIVLDNATNIYEQHDLDTNEQWIRFDIPNSNADRKRLVEGLKKLPWERVDNGVRVKHPFKHPSNVDWWFEGLVQQQPANDNALNADIYLVDCQSDNVGYLAINRTGREAYFWCISDSFL